MIGTTLVIMLLHQSTLMATSWSQELNSLDSIQRFSSGVESYRKKDWSAAKATFGELAILFPTSPEIYFNLGLIAYQSQQLGWAIGYFKRSRALDPGFSPTQEALGFLDRMHPHLMNSIDNYFQARLRLWNWSLVFWTAWLIGTAFGFFLIRWLALNKARSPSTAVMLSTWALGASLASVFALAAWKWQMEKEPLGVAVESAALRSAPLESSPEIGATREGQEVRLLREHQDWVQIHVSRGLTGWVRRMHVLPLHTHARLGDQAW